jgi:small-conductance mechanosensitive channel
MFPLHNDPAIAGYPVALAGNVAQDLLQLFGTLSPAEQAEIERQMALRDTSQETPRESAHESALAVPDAKEPEDSPPSTSMPTEKDELDRLADHLDEMDL